MPSCLQVFVGGEFIGGADIVEEMNGSGETCAPFVGTCCPLNEAGKLQCMQPLLRF